MIEERQLIIDSVQLWATHILKFNEADRLVLVQFNFWLAEATVGAVKPKS